MQLTAKYVYYVYILETAYGAIVGTNYLLVFVLLVIVYSKSLIHIKKLRKQLGKAWFSVCIILIKHHCVS